MANHHHFHLPNTHNKKLSDLTEEEKQGIAEIRKTVKNIPPLLDGDLNLLRWWRYYKGDMDGIKEYLTKIIEIREANGFDRDDHTEEFQFPKVMKSSDYVKMCFGYEEYFLREVLELEKQTQQEHSIISVFDAKDVKMLQWCNPLAANVKLWHLRINYFELLFPGIVSRVYVINSSGAVDFIWKIARLLVPASLAEKIVFTDVPSLTSKYLEPEVVPKVHGGTLINKSGWGSADDPRHDRIHAKESDHYDPLQIWKAHEIDPPEMVRHVIHPRDTFTLEFETTPSKCNDLLLYQYHVNGEIDLRIEYHDPNNTDNIKLLFYLPVITTKIPEDGQLKLSKSGTYKMHFINHSHHWNIKLDLATYLKENTDVIVFDPVKEYPNLGKR